MVVAFEDMLGVLMEQGFEPLEESYTANWLHTNQRARPRPLPSSHDIRTEFWQVAGGLIERQHTRHEIGHFRGIGFR